MGRRPECPDTGIGGNGIRSRVQLAHGRLVHATRAGRHVPDDNVQSSAGSLDAAAGSSDLEVAQGVSRVALLLRAVEYLAIESAARAPLRRRPLREHGDL